MLLKSILMLSLMLAFSLAWSDGTKHAEGLNGTWLPATAELGGKPFPEEFRKITRLMIDGERYTVTVGDQIDRGTVKLDSSAKPKALDITGTEGPNKGKTIPAIYERDGDTLRVCYDLSGQSRPKEFKTTEGSLLFLVTYQREKP